jgi:hypothetical protein
MKKIHVGAGRSRRHIPVAPIEEESGGKRKKDWWLSAGTGGSVPGLVAQFAGTGGSVL